MASEDLARRLLYGAALHSSGSFRPKAAKTRLTGAF
jgi:hypothetical protein